MTHSGHSNSHTEPPRTAVLTTTPMASLSTPNTPDMPSSRLFHGLSEGYAGTRYTVNPGYNGLGHEENYVVSSANCFNSYTWIELRSEADEAEAETAESQLPGAARRLQGGYDWKSYRTGIPVSMQLSPHDWDWIYHCTGTSEVLGSALKVVTEDRICVDAVQAGSCIQVASMGSDDTNDTDDNSYVRFGLLLAVGISVGLAVCLVCCCCWRSGEAKTKMVQVVTSTKWVEVLDRDEETISEAREASNRSLMLGAARESSEQQPLVDTAAMSSLFRVH